MKTRTITIVLCLVSAGSAIGQQQSSTQGQPPQPQRAFYGWELRDTLWSDVNQIASITGVPVSYRQVPGHPDDPWHGQIFTIPNNTLQPGAQVLNSTDFLLLFRGPKKSLISIGPTWTTAGLMPRAGWQGFTTAGFAPAIGNTREVNQSNVYENRGIGTALVYYASKARWDPLPGGALEFELHRRGSWSWFIGGHLTVNRLDIQRGYDRYDELNTLDHKSFATILTDSTVVGLKFGQVGDGGEKNPVGAILMVGYGVPFTKLNPAAKGAQISFNDKSLVVGVAFFFRHTR